MIKFYSNFCLNYDLNSKVIEKARTKGEFVVSLLFKDETEFRDLILEYGKPLQTFKRLGESIKVTLFKSNF